VAALEDQQATEIRNLMEEEERLVAEGWVRVTDLNA
jgi:hypothetical protein